MAQADFKNSITAPAVSRRRRFLSQAAGVAAGGTVLALATPQPPPRACWTRYSAQSRPIERPAAYVIALAEHTRLDRLGDPAAYLISEAPFMAQLDALNDLIGTAPTTFVGLQAWASHLNEIRHVDEAWMFEEEAPTLVVTLVAALGNLAVTS